MDTNTLAKALVLIAAFSASGCASIVSSGKQQLTFNSEPDEATVTVAGKVLGKTPVTTQVDRAKNLAVTFEKEGYKTYTTQLSTTFNAWFWGNIVFGGVLGSSTDAMSGAIHEYSPSQYMVTLVPEKPFGMEQSRPRDVKQLVVGSGSEIRTELANDGGEHVEALLKLLNVLEASKAQAVAALKKMASTTRDDLEFAKKVIEVYEVK